MFRVDMRAAMAGEMTTVLRTHNLLKNTGRGYFGNVPITTPTFIGSKGDIVVDSLFCPTQVIGVADGKGHVVYKNKKHFNEIKKIELEILKSKIDGGFSEGDDTITVK